jgi:hypothetical protein
MSARTVRPAAVPLPAKLSPSDLLLLLGIFVAVFTVVCIFAFASGESAVALGILWGWLAELAIWVYVFVSAI